jgi:hypothetical protein
MAERDSKHSGGSGFFSRLISLFLLACLGGLGFALYCVSQPQDLSDLQRKPGDSAVPSGRELKVVLRNAVDRGYPVTLTEVEINEWLGRTLVARQEGLLREKVRFERVWVRLEDDLAEVVMERKLWGHPLTVSMYLEVERMEGPQGLTTEIRMHGKPFHEDLPNLPRGGRFGQLVVPQGFLLLVMPAYQKLADVFQDEISLAFSEMNRFKIEKNQLVLDPREPLGNGSMQQPF